MSYIHGLIVAPQWYIHPNRNKTMYVPVIDTLRYANRLKDAGVEASQAEAMARAFNDELVHGVATKDDLNQAVVGLTHEIGRAETELKNEIGRAETELKNEIGRVETELKNDIGRVETELKNDIGRVESEIGRVERELKSELKGEIGRLDERFDGVKTQFRYVFLVLGLIAVLGLYNAVGPRPAVSIAGPTEPSPAAHARPPPTPTAPPASEAPVSDP